MTVRRRSGGSARLATRALVSLALVPTAASAAVVNGNRLHAGTSCYAIVRDGAVAGATLQTVRASTNGGQPTWDIVVHQRQNDGRFDMRDHFVLRRASLLPLTMDSQRGRDPAARGWHRVSLAYADGRVTGRKETAAGVTAIDAPLAGATWDGNLWGLTFAALPLRAGGRYTLPVWQYDKGAGTFIVNVVGRQPVETPAGTVQAWALDAGDDPANLVRYYVATGRAMELGYRAGSFEQRLGGDCRDLT